MAITPSTQRRLRIKRAAQQASLGRLARPPCPSPELAVGSLRVPLVLENALSEGPAWAPSDFQEGPQHGVQMHTVFGAPLKLSWVVTPALVVAEVPPPSALHQV